MPSPTDFLKKYWVTYVPVVVNMTASSPEEQMLQHPSTKRKRKTIVVRDPNQDNKDITEEIISEAGRSRKPTLPVGNVFSVPMPLQLPADDKIYLGSNFGGRRLNWKNGCNGETSARATSGASVKLDAVPDSTTNKLRYQRRKWRNALNPLLRSFYT
ncbi:eukaryotic translation initiation factor 4 gamma 3-like isoform X3 [Silurus meridionalis]|uniref:eukaryotic translation initiation factor 4 gamma 3-like isoform X3 n=1 Tax=Silurus meridionalis TaxID=175797 RepID=UPI001EEC1588|nr:eukaryotic translation initiation factor 4 gamma 3-like isoform X3 [Silurus meridionalis]